MKPVIEARSLWHSTLPPEYRPEPVPGGPGREPLGGDVDADVVIVGGGFTGLWTARYLLDADPSLRVVVLEREFCGFGASGRNGGWASALFAGNRDRLAAVSGREGVTRLLKAMQRSVDEVGVAAAADGIDCHYAKGGTLCLALNPAHVTRLQAEIEHERSWGMSDDDVCWLDEESARARVQARGLLGAMFTPHCAAIHPARLARGLALAVERRGGRIHEGTNVAAIESRSVRTAHGTVRADVVVRATEGYTPQLPGLRRAVIPLYSLMIATEPLPDDVWAHIGLHDRQTFTDGRHLIVYGQRTADGRLAFGGRGAPYHAGSRVRDAFDREPAVFADLHRVLLQLFPVLDGVRITHEWGGPLAVPRDWTSSVGFDHTTGLAWAGGYVGDGVTTTNLAGRTLADLILERDTDLVRLPWVGHRSRRWEPEPLRWVGVNAGRSIARAADRAEARRGRPGVLAAALTALTGR